MNENPNCDLCSCWKTAGRKSVCLKGGGGDNAKLLILLDHPNKVEDIRGRALVSNGVEWLRWALSRMSVARSDVYVDYVVKCFPGRNLDFKKKALRAEIVEQCMVYRVATLQQIKPKAIIAMGRFSCEALTGRSDKVKESEGTFWTPNEPAVREFVQHIWVSYSPAYALEAMAESVGIFRVLWHASIDAGLKPKIDAGVAPFDYGT